MPANPIPPPPAPHISRRRFLQAAAYVCLGLAVQACVPTSTVPPPIPWVAPTPTPTATPTSTPTSTPTPAPTSTPTDVPTSAPTPTPAVPVPSAPALELIRPIGQAYPLPPGFAPSALHTLVSYPYIQVQPGREGLHGHPEAAAALNRLFEAARQAGITDLTISSAYRTRATQAYMWEAAGGWRQSRVAPPDTSEHQSGLAFDFATHQTWFEASAAHRWLRANTFRFGFVNTYPRPGIDGVQAEPWHYRYVGTRLATQLYELGYLDPASTVNPIEFYAGQLENRRP